MTQDAERAQVISWLRDKRNHQHPDWAFAKVFADAIEQGKHLKDPSDQGERG